MSDSIQVKAEDVMRVVESVRNSITQDGFDASALGQSFIGTQMSEHEFNRMLPRDREAYVGLRSYWEAWEDRDLPMNTETLRNGLRAALAGVQRLSRHGEYAFGTVEYFDDIGGWLNCPDGRKVAIVDTQFAQQNVGKTGVLVRDAQSGYCDRWISCSERGFKRLNVDGAISPELADFATSGVRHVGDDTTAWNAHFDFHASDPVARDAMNHLRETNSPGGMFGFSRPITVHDWKTALEMELRDRGHMFDRRFSY